MTIRCALRVLALASCVAVTGCARGCTSSRPPIHINPSMYNQPKVLPQTASTFFYDGSSMRPPVPGTVAIDPSRASGSSRPFDVAQGRPELVEGRAWSRDDGLREDPVFFTGKGADGEFVATIPATVDDSLRARGHERYVIYCQPCHDARGDGKGILYQRANIPTASFHQDKILKYPDGQIFDVITNGSGLMPGYRWPIPPADRWAIIAYVRELEQKRSASTTASPDANSTRAKAEAGK